MGNNQVAAILGGWTPQPRNRHRRYGIITKPSDSSAPNPEDIVGLKIYELIAKP
jgi:hypothetical protein